MLMLSTPICYSVNSTAMGDVLAAVPIVKYAIETYHQETDYRVVASKHFREFFHFVPDEKFLVMEDDTWKFDKPYALKRLNDTTPNRGSLCRLIPSKISLSHYASVNLCGQLLNNSKYSYLPLPEVSIEHFGLKLEKCIILVASYRDVNRSIPEATLTDISQYIFDRGYTPVYVGKTDAGAWKSRSPISPCVAPDFALDLRNKTTILELASIIKHSAAIIGVDSGVLHLAGTTSTPIIASYTNVDWRFRVPVRDEGRIIIVEPDSGCRYCSSLWEMPAYDFLNCYYGHNNCVKSLTTAKYISALETILSDRPRFIQVWDQIKPSLLGEIKSKNLYYELLRTQGVEGDLAEIGVYQGKTSRLMKLVFPEKKLHCYDTFCGIANSDSSIDQHKDGEFAVPLEKVKSLLGENNIEYHVGIFPESFVSEETKPNFSFVHVDLDTYDGTKTALEHIFPRLVTGGILLFDDYRWPSCLGVEKAIQEWLVDNRDKCSVREYKYQCAIQKLS